jgi:murein DD-endopeptidase MepM/ murein hydrolase activator NlpD
MSQLKEILVVLLGLVMLSSAQALWADLSLDGRQMRGGLMTGRTLPGTRVEQDGKAVRVSPDGLFLIAFGRDYPLETRLKLVYPDGRVEQRTLALADREYQIQRIDGLPDRKVTPQQRDLERIRKESAMIGKARLRDDPRVDFLSGWIWPATGSISGVYGSQRVLNGQPRRPHFGVDIAAPVGTPVRAPADGLVTLAHPDMFYSGATLVLDHGHNLSSSFLHLDKILVKVGDRVQRGDVIAEVGKSGRVTGAHLDWRMNYHAQRIDPQLLVPPMPEQ